jgi:N utilization substance protein B
VAGSKSPRRRAREFVIQGLYQWQVAGQDEAAIQVQAEACAGFDKSDTALYATLLNEATHFRRNAGSRPCSAYRPALG